MPEIEAVRYVLHHGEELSFPNQRQAKKPAQLSAGFFARASSRGDQGRTTARAELRLSHGALPQCCKPLVKNLRLELSVTIDPAAERRATQVSLRGGQRVSVRSVCWRCRSQP